MSALREACERGVVIVAITQCARGSVSNAYETGRTLLYAGIVPGGDMTPEVETSLSLALHTPPLPPPKKENKIINESKCNFFVLTVRADEA